MDSDSDDELNYPVVDNQKQHYADQEHLLSIKSPAPRHQMYMNQIAHDPLLVDMYIAAVNGSRESQRQVLEDAKTRLADVRAVDPRKFDGMFGPIHFEMVKDLIDDRDEFHWGMVTADTMLKFRHFRPSKPAHPDPEMITERERRPYAGGPSPKYDPKAPGPSKPKPPGPGPGGSGGPFDRERRPYVGPSTPKYDPGRKPGPGPGGMGGPKPPRRPPGPPP